MPDVDEKRAPMPLGIRQGDAATITAWWVEFDRAARAEWTRLAAEVRR